MPTSTTKSRRWFWPLIAVGALALMAAGAAWWLVGPEVYTDGGSVVVSAAQAAPRQVVWTMPRELGGHFSSDDQVYEPSLSSDGNEFYFVRGKPGGGAHIYVCFRQEGAWTKPLPLSSVNSDWDDLGPRLTADGKFLLFYSNRPGGLGGYDIWAAPRDAHEKGGWGKPFNLGPSVNSEFDEYSPNPSPDGNRLVFATNRTAAHQLQARAWRATIRETATTDFDLWMATLNSGSAPQHEAFAASAPASGHHEMADAHPVGSIERPAAKFAIPPELSFNSAMEIPHVNSLHTEGASCFSPAGDFLYFASNRPGGFGGFDIYRSRVEADAFGVPENLGPRINTAANETDPALGLGGYRLYFSSDRAFDGADHGARGDHYRIFSSDSREVYASHLGRMMPHLGMSGWLMLVSLLVLVPLLLLLRQWNNPRVGMLQRCLLASLLVHVIVTFALSFVVVTQSVTKYVRHEHQIAIALSSPADLNITSLIRSQISGGLPKASDARASAVQPVAITPAQIKPAQTINVKAPRVALVPPMAAPLEAPRPVLAAPKIEPLAAPPIPPDAVAVNLKMDAPHPLRQVEPAAAAPMPQPKSDQRVPSAPPPAARVEVAMAAAPDKAPAQIDLPAVAPSAMHLPEIAPKPVTPIDVPLSAPAIDAMAARNSAALQHVDEPVAPRPSAASPTIARRAESPDRNSHDAFPTNVPAPAVAASDVHGDTVMPAIVDHRAEISPGAPRERVHAQMDAVQPEIALAPVTTLRPLHEESPSPAADRARPTTHPVADDTRIKTRDDMRIDASLAALPSVANDALSGQASAAAVKAHSITAPAGPEPRVATPVAADVSVDVGPSAGRMETSRLASSHGEAMVPGRAQELAAPVGRVDIQASRSSGQPAMLPSQSLPAISANEAAAVNAQADDGAQPAGTRVVPVPAGNQSAAKPSADIALAATSDFAPALPKVETSNTAKAQPQSVAMAGDGAAVQRSVEPSGIDKLSARANMEVAAPAHAGAAAVAPEITSHDIARIIPGGDVSGPAPVVAMLTPLQGSLGPQGLLAPESPFMRSPEQRKPLVEQFGGTKQSEDAVDHALGFLARTQEPDGRWTHITDGAIRQGAKRKRDIHDSALTALSLLAFLARDNTPAKPGPYHDVVTRAVEYLLSIQGDDGDLRGPPNLRGSGTEHADMYDHGIAALALAETAQMTHDPRTTRAALKAADFIVRAQDHASGGWRYLPGQNGDTSVFGWQVMALHSAEQIGFEIPDQTRKAALHFITTVSSGPHGALGSYRPGEHATPSMTAELLFAGMLLGRNIDEASELEATHFLARTDVSNADPYYWYYASLDLFQMRGGAWKTWNAKTRDALVKLQTTNDPSDLSYGSWSTRLRWGDRAGRVFTTAVATLTLEVYYRYLPLHEPASAVATTQRAP